MTHASYERVIRPKVQGAWNIHNVLLDAEVKLDYFVALSSTAGIIGSRGQSAYAAANTFLDAFMEFRAHNGMPGVALDLTAGAALGCHSWHFQKSAVPDGPQAALWRQSIMALLHQ
jgi:hypothetical protein